MLLVATVCVAAALVASAASAASGQMTNCTGTPNTIPPGVGKPKLLKQVPNGKLFDANSGVEPRLLVAHVFGTPYEMGKAHGALLKDEIAVLYGGLDAWILQQVEQGVPQLPVWLDKVREREEGCVLWCRGDCTRGEGRALPLRSLFLMLTPLFPSPPLPHFPSNS